MSSTISSRLFAAELTLSLRKEIDVKDLPTQTGKITVTVYYISPHRISTGTDTN